MIGFWKVNDLYGEFSNWYLCEIVFDGKKFCSSEQLFMYKKAKFFHDDEIAKEILSTSNQFEIKKLGRMVRNFKQDIWDECCYSLMLSSNRLKYEQNPVLLQLLLSTGEEEICEASPLDRIWGIGLSTDTDEYKDKANWKGKNLLGQVLMQIRSEGYKIPSLSQEEKDWLKLLIKFSPYRITHLKLFKNEKTNEWMQHYGPNYLRGKTVYNYIDFYDEWEYSFMSPNIKSEYFSKLENGVRYSLKELGLED